jgi:hypothetical protein
MEASAGGVSCASITGQDLKLQFLLGFNVLRDVPKVSVKLEAAC